MFLYLARLHPAPGPLHDCLSHSVFSHSVFSPSVLPSTHAALLLCSSSSLHMLKSLSSCVFVVCLVPAVSRCPGWAVTKSTSFCIKELNSCCLLSPCTKLSALGLGWYVILRGLSGCQGHTGSPCPQVTITASPIVGRGSCTKSESPLLPGQKPPVNYGLKTPSLTPRAVCLPVGARHSEAGLSLSFPIQEAGCHAPLATLFKEKILMQEMPSWMVSNRVTSMKS